MARVSSAKLARHARGKTAPEAISTLRSNNSRQTIWQVSQAPQFWTRLEGTADFQLLVFLLEFRVFVGGFDGRKGGRFLVSALEP